VVEDLVGGGGISKFEKVFGQPGLSPTVAKPWPTAPPHKSVGLARRPSPQNFFFPYILILHYQNFIEIYKNVYDSELDT
jgi:hypothetical protein